VSGGSGSVPLQIVPVITGISKRPGVDATFDLFGSWFMEGASTITIGGKVINDVYTSDSSSRIFDGDVFGNNSSYRLIARHAVEGPIRVETAGGFSQIAGPTFGLPAFVLYTGLTATAQAGTAEGVAAASANTGQSITLTGVGLTNSTLVQFEAMDDEGVAGTITVTGSAGAGGTSLTVAVPALARSGMVGIIGDASEFPLEVVPELRAVGGAVVDGNAIVLEGTGLVEGELLIDIDGVPVIGTVDMTIVNDRGRDQQVVDLTVPAGVGDGVITVTTNGGSFTYTPYTLTTLVDVVTITDVGDTIATALTVTLSANSQVTVDPNIGDSVSPPDVDMFSVTADAGDILTIDVLRIDASLTNSYLRLFDAAGTELSADVVSGPDNNPRIAFTVPTTGTYHIGVSSYVNTSYDPNVAGSGGSSFYTGDYELTIRRVGDGSTSLTGITTTATSGTPARSSVGSAITGQTITLTGSGLLASDRVVFTTVDGNGTFSTATVTPTTVAADGSSLDVLVPTNPGATSGMVRLERENAGLFLQVVPTLTDLDQGVNDLYHNGGLRMRGTGFVEGAMQINFGGNSLLDRPPAAIRSMWAGSLPSRTTDWTPPCPMALTWVRSASRRSVAPVTSSRWRLRGSCRWRAVVRQRMGQRPRRTRVRPSHCRAAASI